MSEQPPPPRDRDQFSDPQQPPQGQQPLPPSMYQYPPHDAYGPRDRVYAPPKKKHNGVWIALAVVLVVVVVLCGVIGMASSGTTKVATDTTSTSSSPPAPASGKWTTTHTFSGNGIKKTETFTVPGDWKLLWKCDPASFGDVGQYNVIVTVTTPDNIPQDIAVNTICKAGNVSGSTEEHQGGKVYLDVNSEGTWTLEVQELK